MKEAARPPGVEASGMSDRGATESWENSYSALDDRDDGYHEVILDTVRPHLPKPVMSPTCARKGHKWLEMPSLFPRRYFPKNWTDLYACERCAKRGMLVLRTDAFEAEV
jgi:hypothetical protein